MMEVEKSGKILLDMLDFPLPWLIFQCGRMMRVNPGVVVKSIEWDIAVVVAYNHRMKF